MESKQSATSGLGTQYEAVNNQPVKDRENKIRFQEEDEHAVRKTQ